MDIVICHNQPIENHSAFARTPSSLEIKTSRRKSESVSPSPKALLVNGLKSLEIDSISWIHLHRSSINFRSIDMNVFELRDRLVNDYSSYTRSFIKIADPRISHKVDTDLKAGAFWPEPLLQLNPSFLPGGTIDHLVDQGMLHPECAKISGLTSPTPITLANPFCSIPIRKTRF